MLANISPDKQGRFLVKCLKINAYGQVITGQDHFPGRFSEVYLIPVKQVNAAQKWDKKQKRAKGDQELCKDRPVFEHFILLCFPAEVGDQ